MKTKSVEEIKAFLQPIAESVGVEIRDIEFKLGKDPSLTIFIDRESGVDLDTCEKFHRAIDEPLDELDPTFGETYTLNVSSLGLDRPLKTERDFKKHEGERVEVKLFAPMKGKKYFEATLKGFDGNCVYFEENGAEFKIELSKIAKINVAIDFDDEK